MTMASQLERLDIPHLPESLSVYIALYRDVQNAAVLRQQLLSGNKEFEYAFIDASMVRREVFPDVYDEELQGSYQGIRFYHEHMRPQLFSELSMTIQMIDSSHTMSTRRLFFL